MSKGVVGIIVGAVAAALVVLAAGCGGGSDSLSKGEFLQQGNAICKKSEGERAAVIKSEVQKLEGQGGKIETSQQEQLVLATLPMYQQAAEELGELTPPDGEEAKVEAIVKAMEEAAANTKAAPATAIDGSVPFKKANELNEEFGLKECVV